MQINGRDGFYKGPVAEAITEHLQARGAHLSMADLASNEPEWVDPVSINYRGYDIYEIPPNGQGMSVLQILNILENFDIGSMGYGSSAHLHHLAEAKKLAYEDMAAYYGDQRFGDIDFDQLLSKEYAAERAALIDPERAGVYHPGLASGDHTIYLTAADEDGNMISLIQSNSSLFGSKEVPEGVGFPLQNRGQGFVLTEDHINTYQPGKRPFHTIIPAFIMKDGEPLMSFGSHGWRYAADWSHTRSSSTWSTSA